MKLLTQIVYDAWPATRLVGFTNL